MKINEVPQDGAFLIEGRMSDLYYVVDDKGHYTKVLSKGWAPKNDAIRLAWERIYEKAEEIRQQILSGILSPIALYMELNVMDVNILASYTGLSRRRVRKHLKMKGFRKLTPELVQTYAGALNLTPDELMDMERIRGIEIRHEN
ncbi:MAG: hypothetical protein H6Q21_2594 [Bacteroidetes bacterium]|jgi:hypothetical protein|nr:hypothetical protein [Bacteroidota bacterium]